MSAGARSRRRRRPFLRLGARTASAPRTITRRVAPMTERLVLASGSPFRKAMLEAAGVDIDVMPAKIDERAVEKTLEGTGASPEDVAQVLAEAKALDVSERNPGRLVLGCDQTLSLGDELFHKPKNMEDARRHLLRLSG